MSSFVPPVSRVFDRHRPRALRSGGVLALLLGLAACGPPIGDFGRPAPSVIHDRILPTVYSVIPGSSGAYHSTFALTGDEVGLRARGETIIAGDDNIGWREYVEATLGKFGYDAPDRPRQRQIAHAAGTAPYVAEGTPPASTVLLAKIRTDTRLTHEIIPFAARVYEADRHRRLTLRRDIDFSAADINATTARIAENRQVVADTILALENRIDDYILDHERGALVHAEAETAWVKRAIDDLIAAVADFRLAVHQTAAPRGFAPDPLPLK